MQDAWSLSAIPLTVNDVWLRTSPDAVSVTKRDISSSVTNIGGAVEVTSLDSSATLACSTKRLLSAAASLRTSACLRLDVSVVTAFSLDESSHWDRYALTMPIGRKDLVAAKYVMVLITIGAAFILSGIMTVVIRFRMGESTDMQGWMADGLPT